MSKELDTFFDQPGSTQTPKQKGGIVGRAADRLRQAAQDPELRARVLEVVRPYGTAAVHGAMIEAGVAKIVKKPGKVKVKKFGTGKAALRPTRTARKAFTGAVKETRSAVKHDVVSRGADLAKDVGSQLAATSANTQPQATSSSESTLLALHDTEDMWDDSDFGRHSSTVVGTSVTLPTIDRGEDIWKDIPPTLPADEIIWNDSLPELPE